MHLHKQDKIKVQVAHLRGKVVNIAPIVLMISQAPLKLLRQLVQKHKEILLAELVLNFQLLMLQCQQIQHQLTKH